MAFETNVGKRAINAHSNYNNVLLQGEQRFYYVAVHFSSTLSTYKTAESIASYAKRVTVLMMASLDELHAYAIKLLF